jgi:hypothetical protein
MAHHGLLTYPPSSIPLNRSPYPKAMAIKPLLPRLLSLIGGTIRDVQKSKYVTGLVGKSEFLNCSAS